ncbi:hypothetical protein KP77_14480 [Jeotgalibacillus alimentarius]|uniref:Uncharacterized protein n=1 Tax=Jeotgalibacillus alimentarius TaxID=135826 RepID=A0A0C2W1T8_9BACL|nr:hypothetical protein [Jeotgalibacillus alimentarius]KIL50073.1 hypothetical protein KP77_14480 [Jeotgalibacillus alimentarius]
MKISTIMKWVTGSLEAVLAIPILGGTLIISTGWSILWIMLALHIVALIFAAREFTSKTGSIFGIFTSVFGFVPLLGFIMHVITAIILLLDASRSTAKEKSF